MQSSNFLQSWWPLLHHLPKQAYLPARNPRGITINCWFVCFVCLGFWGVSMFQIFWKDQILNFVCWCMGARRPTPKPPGRHSNWRHHLNIFLDVFGGPSGSKFLDRICIPTCIPICIPNSIQKCIHKCILKSILKATNIAMVATSITKNMHLVYTKHTCLWIGIGIRGGRILLCVWRFLLSEAHVCWIPFGMQPTYF